MVENESLIERELFLDCIPEKRISHVVSVANREDTDRLYSEFYMLEHPPGLYLDCRSLPAHQFNNLLKFLEEYKGQIQLAAIDPVPPPVISRFTRVKKGFEPRGGSLLGLRFRNLPNSIKGKVFSLFGIEQGQQEE